MRYACVGAWKLGRVKTLRIVVSLNIDKSYAWGFFNCACQGDIKLCGEILALYLKQDQQIFFKATMGEGTNKLAELDALSIMLRLVV